MTIRVWVIEADETRRSQICRHLSDAGMAVRGIGDTAILRNGMPPAPDVVICNAELHGESGLSVAAWARIATGAGVILLAADDRRDERIVGLALGLDHCLATSVDLRELELFVRNLSQRVATSARPPARGFDPRPDMTAGPSWHFDVSRWQLTTPGGAAIALSLAEHLILGCLIQHAGDVVSRDALLTALKGRRISVYSRNLDMIVSRLRKKVERACGERLPVLSARGVGYVFTGRCAVHREAGAPRPYRTHAEASPNQALG